jgi:hypothetical protein
MDNQYLAASTLVMLKNLFRSSAEAEETDRPSALVPHRSEVEFALVLVEAPALHQVEHVIRGVIASVDDYGGTVLQILGSLILVGFSGVLGASPNPRRQDFAVQMCSNYRLFVKVVHGRADALVGMLGSDARTAYTAIPEDFAAILGQFPKLSRGEAFEHVPSIKSAVPEQPANPSGSPV